MNVRITHDMEDVQTATCVYSDKKKDTSDLDKTILALWDCARTHVCTHSLLKAQHLDQLVLA